MFGKSKPSPPSASTLSSGASKVASGARGTPFSVIGSDVIITGNIVATVDLHVDGRVDGDLKCANLVQGETSHIAGAVVADSARMAGHVTGSIDAKSLVILSTARISGDVSYDSLTIEQGAQVDGKLSLRSKTAADKPAFTAKTGQIVD